jgi:nucleoside-diphosphate-sugar epimerase
MYIRPSNFHNVMLFVNEYLWLYTKGKIMSGTVLVAGASGLFGNRVAQAFGAAGWQVRKYRRGSDMAAAALGADVIVNGLNPPMYHNWAVEIPAITAQVLAAAKASGATVIVPGNVYPYGAQPGPWGPGTPHLPCSRKGAVRARMEADYQSSHQRVIILRGGDFLDAGAKTTVMNMVALKDAAKGKIALMGAANVQRAYAYLPDMARVAVGLAEMRAQLPVFADVPFAGLTFSMADLKAEIERQTGRKLRFTAFPWWFMALAAPFWELARELREMRYLSDLPHRLDDAPLRALLPDFRATSFAEVVASHIAALGITAA